MKLSVVIATRDRAAFLARALDSLGEQRDAPPFEAIVVDNGSSDGTAALVERRARESPFELRSIFEAEPNRGAARNRGVAQATGSVVLFVDDDVWLPPQFLRAHARHHDSRRGVAVSGPILNVPSYDVRPSPHPGHYSRAFFCTCNVSVEKAAIEAVGGFDERFELYGWEDTELGVRLRERGVARAFDWDAYLYHIKPPEIATLDDAMRKAIEKGRMAKRFVEKIPSRRARFATGAYALNRLRGSLFVPRWSLPLFAGLATAPRTPAFLRSFARARLLDALYLRELFGEPGD